MINFGRDTAKKFIVFCLLMSLTVGRVFSSSDVLLPLDHFSPTLYNSLPVVEVADEALQSKSGVFDEFLEEASRLSTEHNFSELVGVRLIHRHHLVGDTEVMAESYEYLDDQEALVTRPVKMDSLKEYTPASWIIKDGTIKVFEYSKDLRVRNGYTKLQESAAFISSFVNLLRKYEMEDLVSFSILDREWYGRLSGTLFFTEDSYDLEHSFMSVVRPKDLNETSTDTYINTAWILNTPLNFNSNAVLEGKSSDDSDIVPYTYGCYYAGTRCVNYGQGHRNVRQHGRN